MILTAKDISKRAMETAVKPPATGPRCMVRCGPYLYVDWYKWRCEVCLHYLLGTPPRRTDGAQGSLF